MAPVLRAPNFPMPMDLKAVDRAIGSAGAVKGAAIPALQRVQAELGWLPPEAIVRISERIGVPAAQLYGVATFYTQFRLKPVGKHIVKVCHGTACHVAGAAGISEALGAALGLSAGTGTTDDGFFTVERVACLGCCSLAPVVMIGDEVHGKLTRPGAEKVAAEFRKKKAGRCGCERPSAGIEVEREDLGGKSIERVVVGTGSCGNASGAMEVFRLFADASERLGLGYQAAETGCMGMCHREPLVELFSRDGRRTLYGDVDIAAAGKIISCHIAKGTPVADLIVDTSDPASAAHSFLSGQRRVVLENCGEIDPERIEEYEARGGYEALRKVAGGMTPEAVIAEIKASGLRGRGGAGFPTGLKWEFTRKAKGAEKYVICNADEGDPGAFMDRSVLESDPHRVIEGMIVASCAIGASKGYIYCRAEYPLALKRLRLAIEQARGRGYLGTGRGFDIEVKEGAGAFVCGEETALIASIEGGRGMPRVRPPFPAQQGLWGCPTCINNVETLANVPWIIRHGGAEFARVGTATSKGTKVFALAGDVARGGLVEVPMGVTIREVVEEIGGGTKSGRPVKAVQLGGPSGGCIPASLMDTVVDYEAVTATGAIMGSGGMVVMDEGACMVDIARFFLDFTQRESCGKCTFCRIGTRRMLEILTRITEGEGRPGDVELLEELCARVKEASLCGLGQTAPNPVQTTIRYFREEYDAHISEGRCPAGKCRALIEFSINDRCIGCGACIKACPVDAITGEKKKLHVISREKCTRCGACRQVCPVDAVDVK
ncbi:MAG: NADH-quinone oxidoreductase subunit NuoE [Proteobacteria bacterium]|nr:NADH-quinone oxidoreductase subunit NuoE [Pseudomonadota bacterium]